MKQNLSEKVNTSFLRPTSQTTTRFSYERFDNYNYEKAIFESNQLMPTGISLVIHIPFCLRLCRHCKLETFQTPPEKIINRYLEALHKEIDLILPLLDKKRKITHIQYVGGMPTLYPAIELEELNLHILSILQKADKQTEISIECHPGWITDQGWIQLAKAGFNRFLIGVADFEKEVRRGINRQSFKIPMEEIVRLLRDVAVSIDMGLFYGLPRQTEESYYHTMERAVSLAPDRLIIKSYQHEPAIYPRQKALNKTEIPTVVVKQKMYQTAREILTCNGYVTIDKNLFVQPQDELYTAYQQNKLYRTMIGYCTPKNVGQIYALGLRGISQLGDRYVHNTHDLTEYLEKVEAGILPITKIYSRNKESQIQYRNNKLSKYSG